MISAASAHPAPLAALHIRTCVLDIRNFGFLLKDVSRLYIRLFESHTEEIGVTLPQAKVLAFLSRNEGSTQVRLAETGKLAASLGYGRVAGFLYLAWPKLYPQIRLAVFAVIAFSSSVVDVAAILGPTTPPTLAVRLLQMMNDPDLAMRAPASAGPAIS